MSWSAPEDWSRWDPERLLVCPFDEVHLIKAKRFQHHLLKCRKNHPEKDFVNCPFNAKHVMLRSEVRHHVSRCPDRSVIEQYNYKGSEKDEDGFYFKGNTSVPIYHKSEELEQPSESWDEDAGENSQWTDHSNDNILQCNQRLPAQSPVTDTLSLSPEERERFKHQLRREAALRRANSGMRLPSDRLLAQVRGYNASSDQRQHSASANPVFHHCVVSVQQAQNSNSDQGDRFMHTAPVQQAHNSNSVNPDSFMQAAPVQEVGYTNSAHRDGIMHTAPVQQVQNRNSRHPDSFVQAAPVQKVAYANSAHRDGIMHTAPVQQAHNRNSGHPDSFMRAALVQKVVYTNSAHRDGITHSLPVQEVCYTNSAHRDSVTHTAPVQEVCYTNSSHRDGIIHTNTAPVKDVRYTNSAPRDGVTHTAPVKEVYYTDSAHRDGITDTAPVKEVYYTDSAHRDGITDTAPVKEVYYTDSAHRDGITDTAPVKEVYYTDSAHRDGITDTAPVKEVYYTDSAHRDGITDTAPVQEVHCTNSAHTATVARNPIFEYCVGQMKNTPGHAKERSFISANEQDKMQSDSCRYLAQPHAMDKNVSSQHTTSTTSSAHTNMELRSGFIESEMEKRLTLHEHAERRQQDVAAVLNVCEHPTSPTPTSGNGRGKPELAAVSNVCGQPTSPTSAGANGPHLAGVGRARLLAEARKNNFGGICYSPPKGTGTDITKTTPVGRGRGMLNYFMNSS